VGGGSSRVEIAKNLGVSKSSLTRSTQILIGKGFVAERTTRHRPALGRPSEILEVVPDSAHFAGIKLTGDRLYAAVTDLSASVVESHDAHLSSRSSQLVVNQIGGVIDDIRARYPGLLAAGVTLAGTMIHDSDGRLLVEESEFLGWRNLHLADELGARAGMAVAVENDVQALTAAEHWFGAGAGLDSMVLITIGEGIGCGLVANDRMVGGANGLAGRINHHLITAEGPVCKLGHVGCASAYLTNSAIADATGRKRGVETTYSSAVQLAREGDADALDAFSDAGFALGTLIGIVGNLLDPACVVVSGDGIAVWELAQSAIHEGVEKSCASAFGDLDIRVRPFDFGEWARSAAVLALRSSFAA
jgi:predicted NBD/HSP70 family sugar kinase